MKIKATVEIEYSVSEESCSSSVKDDRKRAILDHAHSVLMDELVKFDYDFVFMITKVEEVE